MNSRALITGCAALLLATGAARADPLPDIYLGRWCLSENSHHYDVGIYRMIGTEEEWKTCQDRDANLEIKRSGWERYEDSCKFISIKYTGEKMPVSTKPRKEDWIPVVRIIARCYVEG